MIKYIIILFLFAVNCLAAQDFDNEENLLLINASDSLLYIKYPDRDVKFKLLTNKNRFSKVNPVNLVFSGMMHLYRKYVSPQLGSGCLYSPSCSGYSKELFAEYGFLKAYFCTADRLSRCNRISATSIHPLNVNEHDHKVHEKPDYYRIKELEK